MLETRCKYYENEAMFHGFIPHIMGTRFDILLIHSDIDRLNTLWADIAYELERLDKILNRFDPHSEVSKINNHASQSKIQISKEMKSILQLCSYYYETTSHLFDITLKDFSQIQLHEHSYISFTSPDISLDYGDCWKVSFLNPYNQSLLKEFDLQDTALSTSGNTLQYTGHIMNPLTGIFNKQRKASSILSPDPLEAEILSTVWMIANEQEQKKISEKFNNIQATLYNL